MDSLKESLTKGIATINVKTNNFMEESKCKTYISTLEKNRVLLFAKTVGCKTYQHINFA